MSLSIFPWKKHMYSLQDFLRVDADDIFEVVR